MRAWQVTHTELRSAGQRQISCAARALLIARSARDDRALKPLPRSRSSLGVSRRQMWAVLASDTLVSRLKTANADRRGGVANMRPEPVEGRNPV
jgi:hypothetical protein